MIFDDHHAYTQENVAKLLKGHQTIVTTGKDAVKLLPLWDSSTPLWVLEQQAETEEGLASSICGFIDK
ncbi:MAG: tetraacyldisaccharide 4'-kinase, partial [Ghiorsea sp.]|nr:tetraacyldisaccharide 4'-kinase [Ghiorsea sp.]